MAKNTTNESASNTTRSTGYYDLLTETERGAVCEKLSDRLDGLQQAAWVALLLDHLFAVAFQQGTGNLEGEIIEIKRLIAIGTQDAVHAGLERETNDVLKRLRETKPISSPEPHSPEALTDQQVSNLVKTIASRYDDSEQTHALLILAHEMWKADQVRGAALIDQITHSALPWIDAGKEILEALPNTLRATLETPDDDAPEPDDDSGEGSPPPQAEGEPEQEGEDEDESTQASSEQIEGWGRTICGNDADDVERTKAFLLLISEFHNAEDLSRIDRIQFQVRVGALQSDSHLFWLAGRELTNRLRVQDGLPPVNAHLDSDLPSAMGHRTGDE